MLLLLCPEMDASEDSFNNFCGREEPVDFAHVRLWEYRGSLADCLCNESRPLNDPPLDELIPLFDPPVKEPLPFNDPFDDLLRAAANEGRVRFEFCAAVRSDMLSENRSLKRRTGLQVQL